MSEKIIDKYFEESESARQPICATIGSAGYDLFAAQAMTLLPHTCELVSLDCIWEIPTGYYGKIYPRSSLVKKIITVDSGLIDSDYCGIVEMLIVNYSEAAFTVCVGDRVGQVVFVKRIDVDFEKVEKKELLGKTKRGEGGFGSTGTSVIKKLKIEDDLEITSEEAIMEVNDKIILVEKVTN